MFNNMSNVSVMCRVCLDTNVRIFLISEGPLQQMYEKITDIRLLPQNGKLLACYICASRLRRCQQLAEKAIQAYRLLTECINSGTLASKLHNELDVTPTTSYTVQEKPEVKIEVSVKIEEGLEEEPKEETSYSPVPDWQSDSEDDIPLKDIKKEEEKPRKLRKDVEPRKKRDKNFKADYAREIILNKEQQLKELRNRAKSLNYLNSPYKCVLCYKGFVDTRAYSNHLEKHDERSGGHVCEICHMRYKSERHLRTHVVTSHSRQYACNKCRHVCHTANQAREHEKWHGGHTYECKICGQKFRKQTSYLTHMRKNHPTQYVCDICGESFVGSHGLVMHKTKTHARDQPQEAPEPASERYCEDCEVQFVSVDAWKRHVLTYHKKALANENSTVCPICRERVPAPAALRLHLKQHDRELRGKGAPPPKAPAALPCEQCPRRFENRSRLHAHVKRVHLGLKYNKNIVCEVCGKKCTSNAALTYHQRTHTGERPHACTTCGKRFVDRNQLRIHNRTHTGERPYGCTICGKRFSQKPALNRHYRVHSGAKPYQCELCPKTFSQSNSLKLHVRTVHLKMPGNKRKSTETKPLLQ